MTSTLQQHRQALRQSDRARADVLSCRLGRHTRKASGEACACGAQTELPHVRLWESLAYDGSDRALDILQRLAERSEGYDGTLLLTDADNWRWAEGYADRGYPDAPKGVVFADWNVLEKTGEILEALGYEIDWEDEYLICDCGKAFRTSPDCMSWTMYGTIGDGDYMCGDCVADDAEYHVKNLEAEAYHAPVDSLGVDLQPFGYGDDPLCEIYASDACKVVKFCSDRGYKAIFQRGTYYSRYEVWIRSESDSREPEDIDGPAVSNRVKDLLPCGVM